MQTLKILLLKIKGISKLSLRKLWANKVAVVFLFDSKSEKQIKQKETKSDYNFLISRFYICQCVFVCVILTLWIFIWSPLVRVYHLIGRSCPFHLFFVFFFFAVASVSFLTARRSLDSFVSFFLPPTSRYSLVGTDLWMKWAIRRHSFVLYVAHTFAKRLAMGSGPFAMRCPITALIQLPSAFRCSICVLSSLMVKFLSLFSLGVSFEKATGRMI